MTEVIIINFEQAVEKILKHEGGYVDHEHDRGGETNFGITKQVARSWGYTGDMADLPRETAKQIYRDRYWNRLQLEEFEDGKLRYMIFDQAVNMGAGTAVRELQHTYNILTGADIAVDGIVGPQTISHINGVDNSQRLRFAYMCARGDRYMHIVDNDSSQQVFINGWFNRLISVAQAAQIIDEGHSTQQQDLSFNELVDRFAEELKNRLG